MPDAMSDSMRALLDWINKHVSDDNPVLVPGISTYPALWSLLNETYADPASLHFVMTGNYLVIASERLAKVWGVMVQENGKWKEFTPPRAPCKTPEERSKGCWYI